MTVTIRRASLSDAEQIGPVHAQAWREAYAGILSDEWLENVSDSERIAKWHTILSEPNPAQQWVVEVDDKIVGFSASGPPRDANPIRSLELWSLHVLRSHTRVGIGTALVAAAVGNTPASLWVLEANYPAQRFYTAMGFSPDGARGILTSWENVPEIRMSR